MHINGNGGQRPKATPTWLLDIRRLNGSSRLVIEQLFLRACLTLEALDDRSLRFFDVRTSWPKYAREYFDAYSVDPDDEREAVFVPSPADHDRMLEVLAWGAGLDNQQWRIVRDRAAGFSGSAIADRVHVPPAAVAVRYAEAITAVVRAALVDAQ